MDDDVTMVDCVCTAGVGMPSVMCWCWWMLLLVVLVLLLVWWWL